MQSPGGNPQTFNRYSYAGNNPVNNIDPTGHSWFKKFFGKIIGAIAGIVTGIVTGNPMLGLQMYNLIDSAWTAGVTGNWKGFGIGMAISGLSMGVGLYAQNGLQAAIGYGLVGGVGAAANGGDFGIGFLIGAAGGAISELGAHITAQDFFGAGLAGNIVNSGGQSMISNAAAGGAWDDGYSITLGPLSVGLAKGAKPSFGVSSLSNLWALGEAIMDPSAKFDLGKTISAGTPVFKGGSKLHGPYGRTVGNTIYLGDQWNSRGVRDTSGVSQQVFAHERIHATIQNRYGGGSPASIDFSNYLSSSTQTKIYGGQERVVPTNASWQFEKNAQRFRTW